MLKSKSQQPKRTRSYVEAACSAIAAKPSVKHIVVTNQKGDPIKTTMDDSDGAAVRFAGLYSELMLKVQRGLNQMDAENELTMLRVRSKTNETLIVPDGKITIMVVQAARDGNMVEKNK